MCVYVCVCVCLCGCVGVSKQLGYVATPKQLGYVATPFLSALKSLPGQGLQSHVTPLYFEGRQ